MPDSLKRKRWKNKASLHFSAAVLTEEETTWETRPQKWTPLVSGRLWLKWLWCQCVREGDSTGFYTCSCAPWKKKRWWWWGVHWPFPFQLLQPTESHHPLQELVGHLLRERRSPTETHWAIASPAAQGVQAAAHRRQAEVRERPRALRVLQHSKATWVWATLTAAQQKLEFI